MFLEDNRITAFLFFAELEAQVKKWFVAALKTEDVDLLLHQEAGWRME